MSGHRGSVSDGILPLLDICLMLLGLFLIMFVIVGRNKLEEIEKHGYFEVEIDSAGQLLVQGMVLQPVEVAERAAGKTVLIKTPEDTGVAPSRTYADLIRMLRDGQSEYALIY